MKKKLLTAAIGAFVCSLTLGAALYVAPAAAANDKNVLNEQFNSSTLDNGVWTSTGDVSMVSTGNTSEKVTVLQGFETAGLVTWPGMYTSTLSTSYVTEGNYSNCFTSEAQWYEFHINVGTIDVSAYDSFKFDFTMSAGAALKVNGTNYGSSGVFTIPASQMTSGTYVMVIDSGVAGESSVYIDNFRGVKQLSDYTATFATSGGSITSVQKYQGFDMRYGSAGWEGATQFDFYPNLAGLGDATFKAALGDLALTISPDGGRYVLTLWDGDTPLELQATDAGTDNSIIPLADKMMYVSVRYNGAFSVNYNGIDYIAKTKVQSSYGSIHFSVTDGATSPVSIDKVSLVVDEWQRDASSVQEVTTVFQDFETVSIATGTTGVASVATSTEHVTQGSYSNVVTTSSQWFELQISLDSADFAGYESISFDYALATGPSLVFYYGGVEHTAASLSGTWTLDAATFSGMTKSGVFVIVCASSAGSDTFYIDNIRGTKQVAVANTDVCHVFKDETGVVYYASKAAPSATVEFSSIAPKAGPKKAGYTFAGWRKDGQAVGTTVDNTQDATYTPVYVLGEVKYVSASLNGDIGLNFYLDLPAAVLADDTAKLVFTMGETTQEVKVSDGVSTDNGMKYTAGVAAQYYDQMVVLTLVTKAGDGVTYEYKVKQYIDNIISSDKEEHVAFQNLALAMQNYCAAAKDYFTGATVTENYVDVTPEVLSAYKYVFIENNPTEDVYLYSPTVLMESKTSLRVYFTGDEAVINTLTYKIDGAPATLKSKYNGNTMFYYLEVEDIAAQDLDKTYDFTIGGQTIRMSALSYVYLALKSASSYGPAYVNAVRAMYLYNQAADNYFNAAQSGATAQPVSYWDDDSDWNNTFDFVLNVEEGRDVKILQLTDVQIIDAAQKRYESRLPDGHIGNTSWVANKLYLNAFRYMREAIEKSNPDLIVLTGDNVYGEFDDSSAMLKALIKEMESYEIPWTLIWGNHDNETYKGTKWLGQQYASADYCRFTVEDEGITGSGNFTVGVVQGGALTTALFMVDSNGHTALNHTGFDTSKFPADETDYILHKTAGVQQDQIDWIARELAVINQKAPGVSSIGFTHHALQGMKQGLVEKYGYAPEGTGLLSGAAPRLILTDNNLASTVTPKDGDFGAVFYEPGWTDVVGAGGNTDLALHNVSKNGGLVGWFFGHIHHNSASVYYDGVRYTNGIKAGLYDDYISTDVGGTMITIGQGRSMNTYHLYTDLDTTRP